MDFLQQPTNLEDNKPKRGRPRKEVRVEEVEEIEDVKIINLSDDTSNYVLSRVPIDEIVPNVINGVCVQFERTMGYLSPVIVLSTEITSEILNDWKMREGGVFNSDVKSFIKFNQTDNFNYYTLIHNNKTEGFIVKHISCEEIKRRIFELELNHVIINDEIYLIIKKLDNNLNLTSVLNKLSDSFVYNSTFFNDEEDEEDDIIVPKASNDDEQDSYDFLDDLGESYINNN
ncbi:MAG: hypothetical protein ACRDD8_14720 [Bacteroidales bacterium]